MRVSSAAANKMIKQLEDEKAYLLQVEEEASVYVLADSEKIDPPEYDYIGVSKRLMDLDTRIRHIKHAINQFNTTTVLDHVKITIDEALVEMAQLNRLKRRLDTMRKRLPKSRYENHMYGSSRNLIEYQYVNYDLATVNTDYHTTCDRISAIQMDLDLANQTKFFEIEE